MKVSVVRGGGVSGLVTDTTHEKKTQAADDTETLARRVARQGPLAPDEAQVSVTLEDGARRRTVTAADHDLPSRLRSLVDWVSAAPGRTEEVGSPGT